MFRCFKPLFLQRFDKDETISVNIVSMLLNLYIVLRIFWLHWSEHGPAQVWQMVCKDFLESLYKRLEHKWSDVPVDNIWLPT